MKFRPEAVPTAPSRVKGTGITESLLETQDQKSPVLFFHPTSTTVLLSVSFNDNDEMGIFMLMQNSGLIQHMKIPPWAFGKEYKLYFKLIPGENEDPTHDASSGCLVYPGLDPRAAPPWQLWSAPGTQAVQGHTIKGFSPTYQAHTLHLTQDTGVISFLRFKPAL